MKFDFTEIINCAIEAGKAICEIYNSTNFDISYKADNSPLTAADKKSNAIIMQTLNKYEYPIISEENKQIPYENRKNWTTFWLVDPLDGTKEFIKKNGQFTVNIALIHNQLPILGIIYAPTRKELFFGGDTINGSFKIENIDNTFENFNEIKKSAKKLPDKKLLERNYRAIVSLLHFSEETKNYVEKLRETHKDLELFNVGSSLKFCTIAEGNADIYPRFGPTMEWDIAAGHAIVKFAGGKVINVETQQEMTYNKENLLNPFFIVEN